MKPLIDTNVCINYLRGKNPLVSALMMQHAAADIVVCSVVRAELFHGVERSRNPANRARVDSFVAGFPTLPFDNAAAIIYGRIRHELEVKGLPIGANDLLIAAITLANGLTLVTHDTSDFGRIPSLPLVDWEIP